MDVTAPFPLFDRHPIFSGWAGMLATFSAEALASLQQADVMLSVCIRAVGLTHKRRNPDDEE